MSRLTLARRGLAVALKNPAVVYSLLRRDYRNKWGALRDQRRRPGLAAPPASLNINLTRRCNLDCRMCLQYKGSSRGQGRPAYYDPARELPLAGWQGLLDQARGFRPILEVTGGEPTLYPDFAGFIQYAVKAGFLVNVVTNGTRLDSMARFFVQSGLQSLCISLDGPGGVHDRIRGRKGLFDQVASGVRRLVKLRRDLGRLTPIISINCTVSRHNLGRLHEMPAIARELGADTLQFLHTIFRTQEVLDKHNKMLGPGPCAEMGLNVLQPSIPPGENYISEFEPGDMPVLWQDLCRARQSAKGSIMFGVDPNLGSRGLVEAYYLDPEYPPGLRCHRLWNTCRILPDGEAAPCLHALMGNIRDAGLMEIWNGPDYRKFRRLISQGLFPGCVRCCSSVPETKGNE